MVHEQTLSEQTDEVPKRPRLARKRTPVDLKRSPSGQLPATPAQKIPGFSRPSAIEPPPDCPLEHENGHISHASANFPNLRDDCPSPSPPTAAAPFTQEHSH